MQRNNYNICQKLFKRECSGHGTPSVEKFPVNLFKENEGDVNAKLVIMLHDLLKLHSAENRSFDSLKIKIKEIFSLLLEQETQLKALQHIICDFQTVEVLLEILQQDIFKIEGCSEARDTMVKCPEEHLNDAVHILALASQCLIYSKASHHHLRWNYKLLETLFSLLTEVHVVSNTALSILELILLGTDHPPIKLEKINGFRKFLSDFQTDGNSKHNQLFHVLSSFLSDSEYTASSNQTLEKFDQWLVISSTQIVEANQEFLLSIPEFLEKICSMVGCLTTNPESTQSFVADQLHLLHIFNIQPLIPSLADFIEGSASAISHQQRKVYKSDLIHVISQLLLGKHRDEVQRRLVACEFFDCLNDVAVNMVWRDSLSPQLSPHLVHDEFNVATFMQIQFLRLLHAIADNHINRYYLLSIQEIKDLKVYAEFKGYGLPDDLAKFDDKLAHDAPSGILSFVLKKMMERECDSVVRFWITRSMEAFLRGQTSPVLQSFLIRKGLIEDSVSLLLHCDMINDMVVQGSFDFLSSVMKNNIDGFNRCDKALDCTAKLTLLLKKVDENLVDSNMFLRCIFLTIEHIKRKNISQSGSLTSNRLLNRYNSCHARVDVVARLIRLITVPSLSQENVSCLNTTILLLMFAHRDEQLPWYLLTLSRLADAESLLENLRSLLRFWKLHYSLPSKKQDRNNLEQSTGVHMEEWYVIIDCLLDVNTSSLCSVQHYLRKAAMATQRNP